MGNEDGGFGRRAHHYASSASHRADRSLERVTALLEPRADWRALDIATGAGHTAFTLASRVKQVVALDLSAGMLATARRLAQERRIENVRFLRGDVHALPVRSGSFDAVTCRIAAHHFSRLDLALGELARALRSGGRLLMVDNCAAEDGSCARWMNDFERLRDPSHALLLSPSAWRDALDAAGLRPLTVEKFQYQMAFDLWFSNVEAPPPLRRRLLSMAEAAPEAVRRHVGFLEEAGRLSSFGIDRMVALCEKGE